MLSKGFDLWEASREDLVQHHVLIKIQDQNTNQTEYTSNKI